MSVRTGWSKRTVAFTIGFANGNIAGETEAKAFAEERGEGEFIEARISCRFGGQDMRGGTVDVRGHDGIVCNVLVRVSFKRASKLELVAGVSAVIEVAFIAETLYPGSRWCGKIIGLLETS